MRFSLTNGSQCQTLAAVMSKAIQFIPEENTSERITKVTKAIRTSKAGFCEAAIEFILPKIESGEMAIINGQLQVVKAAEQKAA